jgi:hypothetical protein
MDEQIKILRMITGEDIICSFIKVSSESYVLQDPMLLIIKFKGKESVILMEHWLPIEVIKSNEILINPRDVITMFDPKDSLAEYYQNLITKLHKAIEQKAKLENMEDLNEMIDIMDAIEESQGAVLH